MDEKKRIEELVKTLNEASEAYYNGQDEIMSNYEWDGMFDPVRRKNRIYSAGKSDTECRI